MVNGFSTVPWTTTCITQFIRESPLYAKITKKRGDGEYEAHFTFIPREIRDIFPQLAQKKGEG